MAQQVGPAEDLNWSYSGSNTNVPTIMVFKPSWEEFKDFNKYMRYIESIGAHKAGLAKIIPPKEWVPRKKGYNLDEIMKLKIPDPICQMINGNRGIFQSINVRKNALSLKEFHKKANSSQYRTPPYIDYEDLERRYWKNVTFVPPIYGADVPGSITDSDCKEWNIQRLNSCLDLINSDYNVKIAGVNTAYLYFGMWKTTFAWHTEDMDLHSINYLHYGESKFWYTIPPEYARRFERMAAGLFPNLVKDCPAYLRHKMCLISPNVLRQNSIPYNKIVQREGEFMVTFPLGYHSGFNTGFNIAESTNFATERWVEYGKRAVRCYCRPDNVHISMDCFVKRLQPDQYEDWLNGKNYGRHPEEPTAKPTPAVPPSAEEYLLNPQNKGKEIPLCLLEPAGKKRRHPIHKKKNENVDSDSEVDILDVKKLKQGPVLSLKRIDEDITLNGSTINNSLLMPKLSLTAPKLNFSPHPTFGTLPTKNEFGSGLMSNAWPSTVTSTSNTSSPVASSSKMSDEAKQKWLSSFLSPSIQPMQPQQPQQQAVQFRPPSAMNQFHLRPPSLTAAISKLQNSMVSTGNPRQTPMQYYGSPQQQQQYNYSDLPKNNSNYLGVATPIHYIQPSTDSDLSIRQSMYPEELRKVLQSTGILRENYVPPQQARPPSDKMAVLLDPRFSSQCQSQPQAQQPQFIQQQVFCSSSTVVTPRIMQNKNILASNMERPILSSMVLIDWSIWHPPKLLSLCNQDFLSMWHLKGSVNVAKGEMYVRFDGPQNAKRSFCLPFTNILSTSKRHQNGSVWPPSDDMMNQCDDLSRWTISASVDPFRDIKATVIDPWDKAYLLTIPVKLMTKS